MSTPKSRIPMFQTHRNVKGSLGQAQKNGKNFHCRNNRYWTVCSESISVVCCWIPYPTKIVWPTSSLVLSLVPAAGDWSPPRWPKLPPPLPCYLSTCCWVSENMYHLIPDLLHVWLYAFNGFNLITSVKSIVSLASRSRFSRNKCTHLENAYFILMHGINLCDR